MSSKSYNFGPLPKSDRGQELQTLSLAALHQIFPVEQFIVRDERIDDFGVDASLELKHNGCVTNIRAQVQMKSTDSLAFNADGSFSLSIDTSNLNYLLNGSSPIYILYIASRNELRFAWARDEGKRLETTRSAWQEQASHTIRFTQKLDDAAIQAIYIRIQAEARFERDIQDRLGRASAAERVSVTINLENLAITDDDELILLLTESGLSFVGAGYATEVLDLLDALQPPHNRQPRLLLVRAYADHTLGKYQEAFATTSRVLLQRDTLVRSDQQFLDHVRLACSFHLGRINQIEYLLQLNALALERGTYYNLEAELEGYRYALFQELDSSTYQQLVSRLRSFITALQREPEASDLLKLQANMLLLYVQGRDIVQVSFAGMHRLKMRKEMGFPVDLVSMLRLEDDRWVTWTSKIVATIAATQQLGHPVLFGEVLLTWVKVTTARFMGIRHFSHLFGLTWPPVEGLRKLQETSEQAAEIYKGIGHLHGQLRAELMLADALMLFGSVAEARTIAQKVLPQAEIMDYGDLVAWAKLFCDQTTVWDLSAATFAAMEQSDQDIRMAADSDEDIRHLAKDMLDALELPIERLGVLERETYSMRDVAQERLNWCRHIELIQDTRHSGSTETFYARDPERFVTCTHFQYTSRIGSSDWRALLHAFKLTHCANCSARSPKQSVTNSSLPP